MLVRFDAADISILNKLFFEIQLYNGVVVLRNNSTNTRATASNLTVLHNISA